jgi:hypothetical protein
VQVGLNKKLRPGPHQVVNEEFYAVIFGGFAQKTTESQSLNYEFAAYPYFNNIHCVFIRTYQILTSKDAAR